MHRIRDEELRTIERERRTSLGLVAMERNGVYGTELPISWDELNQRMQKDMIEDKDRGPQESAEPTPREGKGAEPKEAVPPIRE